MGVNRNAVHVVLAADNNYSMPLTVPICSAAVNCERARPIVFHVFQNEITPSNRRRVEMSLARVGRENVTINWLDAPVSSFWDLEVTHGWITSLTFVRLLVADLLPEDIEKAIYLDCDVAVLDDVAELWDLEIGDRSLLAVQDLIGYVGDECAGIVNYRELGIPPDRKYFNAGVLVINLKKWRRCNTGKRLLEYLRKYRAVIRAADQEALNVVLGDDWGELEFRWNWQILARIYRIGTHRPGIVPTTTRKSIVHFHSSEKPWLPACDYEEKAHFFHYLDETEWAGWRVPLRQELLGRAMRPMSDARNALGRWRRKVVRRLSGGSPRS